MRKTKIVCTLGPATDREGVLREMMLAGMNVARFNFSHGTHPEHKVRLDAVKALREELAAAHKEAEERKLEISLLEEELEKAKQRLADTEAQLKESEEKLAKAGPAAAAYEKVKDRTAGIELEAHCRAQAVQAEAEERIRKTRAEVEQWLNRVQGNYGRLRADMDAAVSRACGELDQVRQTLEQISGELARQDEGLDKLTKSCCAELTHRAPDPLPLDEK